MAVRTFDGVDDNVRFPAPALTGAWTLAILCKKLTNLTWDGIVVNHDSGGSSRVQLTGKDDDHLSAGNGPTGTASARTWTTADDWIVLIVGKAEGSVFPRFSFYPLAAEAWTHENGGSSFGDAASAAGGTIRVGEWQASDFGHFRAAVVAEWSVLLSDAQRLGLVEHLATQDWADEATGLEFLADFNQASVTTAVPDLSGNGRDQSARTGTTVSTTDDPPGWTFGVGGGGAIVDGAASLAGEGTLTASATRVRAGQAALSGAGTLAASAGRVRGGAAALSGQATLSASAKRLRHARAALGGVATLSALARRLRAGRASLTGVGTLSARVADAPQLGASSSGAAWAQSQAGAAGSASAGFATTVEEP